jgi:hypothetical protein
MSAANAFLHQFMRDRVGHSLSGLESMGDLSQVRRLPRGGLKEGYHPPYADPTTDPSSRWWGVPLPSTLEDDEPPNPFGGGGGPYLPGARLPAGGESLIANVQRLPRSSRPAGSFPNSIPGIDDVGPRSGSYHTPIRGYQYLDDDFPNPFGGGGGPYMPGARLPVRSEALMASRR